MNRILIILAISSLFSCSENSEPTSPEPLSEEALIDASEESQANEIPSMVLHQIFQNKLTQDEAPKMNWNNPNGKHSQKTFLESIDSENYNDLIALVEFNSNNDTIRYVFTSEKEMSWRDDIRYIYNSSGELKSKLVINSVHPRSFETPVLELNENQFKSSNTSKFSYEYVKENYLKVDYFSSDNDLVNTRHYFFLDGLVTKFLKVYPDDDDTTIITYKYDLNQNLIRKEDRLGDYNFAKNYEYNEDQQLSKIDDGHSTVQTQYFSDSIIATKAFEDIEFKTVFRFKDGQITSRVEYYNSNEIYRENYQYNEKGFLIRTEILSPYTSENRKVYRVEYN